MEQQKLVNSRQSKPEDLFSEAKKFIDLDLEKAMELTQQAAELAGQEKNYKLEVEILTFQARMTRLYGDPYHCLAILSKAFRVASNEIIDNHLALAYIYREYGVIYSDSFQDFFTGSKYFFKCLQLNAPEIQGVIYNNLGSNFIGIEKYDEAIRYLKKGEKISRMNGDYFVLAYILENFGELYKKKKKYDVAIDFFDKGLATIAATIDKLGSKKDLLYVKTKIYIELVECYLFKNDISKAKKVISEGKSIAIDSNFKSSYSELLFLEGKISLIKNEKEKFFNLFGEAKLLAIENSFYPDIIQWYIELQNISEQKKEYKKALEYSKEILKIKSENTAKNNQLKISDLLVDKEQEILELEKKKAEIYRQKEELEQFAYIVTHDLKTPLSNIFKYSELFYYRSKGTVEPNNMKYLDYVLENSKHLSLMLTDLMQFTSLGREDNLVTFCSSEKILKQVLSKNKDLIEENNAQILYCNLPKLTIRKFHLELLFDNLIRNAIKFRRKSVAPIVKINCIENEHQYEFSILDNGIGIPENYYERIFHIYKQLDKVNYQGTGMGLAICKKITNVYQGNIRVVNNKDAGCTFYFTIQKK